MPRTFLSSPSQPPTKKYTRQRSHATDRAYQHLEPHAPGPLLLKIPSNTVAMLQRHLHHQIPMHLLYQKLIPNSAQCMLHEPSTKSKELCVLQTSYRGVSERRR
jgi:hypothetical protein